MAEGMFPGETNLLPFVTLLQRDAPVTLCPNTTLLSWSHMQPQHTLPLLQTPLMGQDLRVSMATSSYASAPACPESTAMAAVLSVSHQHNLSCLLFHRSQKGGKREREKREGGPGEVL